MSLYLHTTIQLIVTNEIKTTKTCQHLVRNTIYINIYKYVSNKSPIRARQTYKNLSLCKPQSRFYFNALGMTKSLTGH